MGEHTVGWERLKRLELVSKPDFSLQNQVLTPVPDFSRTPLKASGSGGWTFGLRNRRTPILLFFICLFLSVGCNNKKNQPRYSTGSLASGSLLKEGEDQKAEAAKTDELAKERFELEKELLKAQARREKEASDRAFDEQRREQELERQRIAAEAKARQDEIANQQALARMEADAANERARIEAAAQKDLADKEIEAARAANGQPTTEGAQAIMDWVPAITALTGLTQQMGQGMKPDPGVLRAQAEMARIEAEAQAARRFAQIEENRQRREEERAAKQEAAEKEAFEDALAAYRAWCLDWMGAKAIQQLGEVTRALPLDLDSTTHLAGDVSAIGQMANAYIAQYQEALLEKNPTSISVTRDLLSQMKSNLESVLQNFYGALSEEAVGRGESYPSIRNLYTNVLRKVGNKGNSVAQTHRKITAALQAGAEEERKIRAEAARNEREANSKAELDRRNAEARQAEQATLLESARVIAERVKELSDIESTRVAALSVAETLGIRIPQVRSMPYPNEKEAVEFIQSIVGTLPKNPPLKGDPESRWLAWANANRDQIENFDHRVESLKPALAYLHSQKQDEEQRTFALKVQVALRNEFKELTGDDLTIEGIETGTIANSIINKATENKSLPELNRLKSLADKLLDAEGFKLTEAVKNRLKIVREAIRNLVSYHANVGDPIDLSLKASSNGDESKRGSAGSSIIIGGVGNSGTNP